VRGSRRRPRRDVEATPLARLFLEASAYHELKRKALLARLRTLITSRGLYLVDAFRYFDTDGDGVLGVPELAAAFVWLGLEVTPASIYELVRSVDRDGDGLVTLDDWKQWMGLDEGQVEAVRPEGAAPLDAASVDLPPPPPTAADGTSAVEAPPLEPLSHADLGKVRIKLVAPKGSMAEVWNSRGTNTPKRASVWAPSLDRGPFANNKERICLGHLGSTSLEKPSPESTIVLELKDQSVNRMFGSELLPRARDLCLPRPVKYRQVWARTGAGHTPLYIWQPLPPSDEFAALGVVCTKSAEPPSLEAVRCVPTAWLEEADSGSINSVWDDSGLGGRPGSLWTVGGLLQGVAGHEPPAAMKMRREEFFLNKESPRTASWLGPVVS